MKTYKELKAKARDEAIEWQHGLQDSEDISLGELADIGDHFHRLGKRYGLLREFRENGIPC